MPEVESLGDHLRSHAVARPAAAAVAEVVSTVASVSRDISDLIAEGELHGSLDAEVGENFDGDAQKALDVIANQRFTEALRETPVAFLGSEEADEVLELGNGSLAVTLDPLDGSSNIATNVSVGSIFSVYGVRADLDPGENVLQPGSSQLAAGFVIYGPQTSLVLSLGAGTYVFTLSRAKRDYWRTRGALLVPQARAEYAINGSNARHWYPPISRFIANCQAGVDGPYGENYNTRWVASLVAEAYRVFARGGIFLYPADARAGYGSGRLRLVYEANAIAFLMEQAGAEATDGQRRILDLQPQALHERTPLVFGSRHQVALVRDSYQL